MRFRSFQVIFGFLTASINAVELQIYSIPISEFNGNIHDPVKFEANKVHILAKEAPTKSAKLEVSSAKLEGLVQNANKKAGDGWYESYHNSTEIFAKYDELIVGTGVVKSSIGKSYDQNDFWMYSWESNAENHAVVMTCTVHAREWIAPASCQYFFEQFLNSAEFEMLRNSINLYLVPIYNIDGYDYTWKNETEGGDSTPNRMWRKNRNPNTQANVEQNRNCHGVDINRNYDSYWCIENSSNNTCDITYCGTAPESELETQAVTKLLIEKKPVAYFDAHSYSQMLLFPYQSKLEHADTYDVLMEAGVKAAQAMKLVENTTYAPGPGGEIIYLHSGGAIDYCYDQLGVDMPFTFELRDTGEYGFLLPPEQILGTAQEYTVGVKSIIESAIGFYDVTTSTTSKPVSETTKTTTETPKPDPPLTTPGSTTTLDSTTSTISAILLTLLLLK